MDILLQIIVVLTGFSTALASPSSSKSCKTSFTAVFEDLPATPLFDGLSIVPVPYDSMSFTGFVVQSDGPLNPITPQSPQNFLTVNILTALAYGPPTIARYSGVKSFALRSLYMGCVTAEPGQQPCKVLATGTKVVGGQTVEAMLTFTGPYNPENPGTLLKALPMQLQTFPASFKGLDNVRFTVVSDDASQAAADITQLTFDNVQYDVVTC